MTPVDFPERNVEIAKDQPQYRTLPAHIDETGRTTFCWKMSWAERLSVLFRGEVWHQVLTNCQPLQPQLLVTEKPEI